LIIYALIFVSRITSLTRISIQCAWRTIRNARLVVHPPLDYLCFNLCIQDYLANELQMAFEKLTNQARFVQMIVADLRGHKFRPFSKTSANTGETEPAEEDNEEEGTQTDFDY